MAIAPLVETPRRFPTLNPDWKSWTGSVVLTTIDGTGFDLSDQALQYLADQLQDDRLEEVTAHRVRRLGCDLLFSFETEGTDELAAYTIAALAMQTAVKLGLDRNVLQLQEGYLAPHNGGPYKLQTQTRFDVLMEDVCRQLNEVATGVPLHSVV